MTCANRLKASDPARAAGNSAAPERNDGPAADRADRTPDALLHGLSVGDRVEDETENDDAVLGRRHVEVEIDALSGRHRVELQSVPRATVREQPSRAARRARRRRYRGAEAHVGKIERPR
jgi:hypothetical protein